MSVGVREIERNEVGRLYSLVATLSDHHNQVSVNFKGSYPSRPYEETLKVFEDSLSAGKSRIAVVEMCEDESNGGNAGAAGSENVSRGGGAPGKIAGFCKVDLDGGKGKLDYLVVAPECRGRGYGAMLMDWAMAQFRENHVYQVEVKVVDGNDAIHLYEKYGFKMNAHLLWFTENEGDSNGN